MLRKRLPANVGAAQASLKSQSTTIRKSYKQRKPEPLSANFVWVQKYATFQASWMWLQKCRRYLGPNGFVFLSQ